jgi:hypothetical protein
MQLASQPILSHKLVRPELGAKAGLNLRCPFFSQQALKEPMAYGLLRTARFQNDVHEQVHK